MQFTILGSGSASPHKSRASSGYWLETANGSLMLDVSGAAFQQAAQENLNWANLDAIWISHFHLDHIGGLAPFLFGTKYAFETQARTKPLRILLRKVCAKFSPALMRRAITAFLASRFRLKLSKLKPENLLRFYLIDPIPNNRDKQNYRQFFEK